MSKVFDILSLPFLAVCVAGFFVYILVGWLFDKRKRAFNADDDGAYEVIDPDSEWPQEKP